MTLNYLGKYDNLSLLWEAHSNGGIEGEYCYVGDQLFVWDKYENNWVEGSVEVLDVIPSDQPERESNNGLNCIGCFESEQQLWSQHPQGGVEGDYVVIAGKEYIWDKYSYSWKPFEPTESSKLRPIDVTYTEGVVAYSEDYINYIGTFDNLDQVWEMYPNGGKDGDYILVNGERLKWNKYTSNWGEDESGDTSPARSVATIYGDLHVFNDLVIGEGLYARILKELSKKQWVQDNFTTKQWLLDQNYARQEWVLDQYEVLQDWVLSKNYTTLDEVTSDVIMQRIVADNSTITIRDGKLVVIGGGGGTGGGSSTPSDIYIIKKGEVASLTDQNVFSALRVDDEFLSKYKGGVVKEQVSFDKGISIGDVVITYDSEAKALCVDGSLYSLGGITAGGVGSDSGGGGGGTSYNRLDSWANYGSDKSGWVLSALLGKDLDDRVSALANAGYITQSALAPYALRSEIPSLEGYATLDALNTLSQTVVNFKSLFDSMFEKDSEGNIHAKLSLWSSGGITAGGAGSSGSGGGGISYNRLDSWSDYSADKSGWVLSALLGNDLNTRLISVENAGYITTSALAPYALRSEIPSLEGYATLDALNTLSQTVVSFKSLFDSMFEVVDGNIHAKLSLWSSGGITAGGAGSSGSGGGGISYNRLDSWSDYSADKSGWVLSALLGNDLNTRLISVENAGYITTSALAPYALRSEIPSLDGYATLDALNTLSQTVVNFKSLFDSMFEKDSDGNIHAKLSLWSSGGITAGGVGSGGSGGGGISYNRLDSWSDYSADKAGYVLSALLGKDLDNRVSALANAGYITASALAPYVLRSEVEGQYLSKNGGTVNGSVTLSIGNIVVSSGDTVVGKIYPRTDNEYTLGQDTRKWKNILCYNINGSTPVNASNLKSTLGISDWALAAAKPTYTSSEVGALSVNGGDIGGSLNFRNGSSITCANGIVLEMYAGVDTYLRGSSNIYISAPNIYTQRNVYTYKVLDSGNYTDYALSKNGGTISDLIIDRNPSVIQYKKNGALVGYLGIGSELEPVVYNAEGNTAYTILHSGNYSSYALPITGGTVNGSITANSFIGNLTGTADNSKGLGGYTWETKQNSIDTWVPVFNVDKIQYRVIPADYNNAPSTLTVKHAGTADSATKLATPRTIWGQSFDGTQDITGALTAPSITANSLTIGGATITYDSVNKALCINGNMYALGGITAGAAGISAYSSLEARVARLEQQLNI